MSLTLVLTWDSFHPTRLLCVASTQVLLPCLAVFCLVTFGGCLSEALPFLSGEGGAWICGKDPCGGELGEMERVETVFGMYCMTKESVFNRRFILAMIVMK